MPAMQFDLTFDLLEACGAGDLERVEEVLQKSSPAWRNATEPSALHAAIDKGDPQIVAALLKHGAPLDVPSYFQPPLHLAVHVDLENQPLINGRRTMGPLLMTRLLLAAGADPAIRARDDATAAWIARGYKCEEAAELLDNWPSSRPSE